MPDPGVDCFAGESQGLEDLSLKDTHWQPFLATFGPDLAAQFSWAVTTDTIETYEHRKTLRFLHIDSVTGECLNQNCEAISRENALQHAFLPRTRPAGDPVEEIVFMDAAEEDKTTAPKDWTGGPVSEPGLNAFMRKMELAETGAEDSVSAAEPFQPEVFGGLNKLLMHTKRNWLGKALFWSHPLTSETHDAGSGHGPNSQEPNFSTFTRRTSAL